MALSLSVRTQELPVVTLVSSVTTRAVPEPSTWAMMLIGFAGLGFAGYKRARGRRAAPHLA